MLDHFKHVTIIYKNKLISALDMKCAGQSHNGHKATVKSVKFHI